MLFTGRLTAKAEVKAVKGDKQVINFTVAINQNGKTSWAKKRKKPPTLTAPTGAIQVSPNTSPKAQSWKFRDGWKHRAIRAKTMVSRQD